MKNILLAVTGSIAAYKAADLVSSLKKAGMNINVLMTANATNFIHPTTFESLTGNKCVVDTFDRNFEFKIGHISLAQSADICVVAPASANIIGKLACGIADDMVSTTLMATNAPVLIAPAMNTQMYHNPIVQDNIKRLKSFGYEFINPASGRLACGDVGEGKLAPVEDIFDEIMLKVAHAHDLEGRKVLITAGPTCEAIDPVRYITNHSTGKMGYALAKAAARRGAKVTLVSGKVSLSVPRGVECVPVFSAEDMANAVIDRAEDQDIFILSAAVADYTPQNTADHKIKKTEGMDAIPLKRTKDILDHLGHNRHGGEFICGFAMETEDLESNAQSKLIKKNADMICANSLREAGSGFGTDTNSITMITADGVKKTDLISKDEVSDVILDEIVLRMGK